MLQYFPSGPIGAQAFEKKGFNGSSPQPVQLELAIERTFGQRTGVGQILDKSSVFLRQAVARSE